MSRCDLMVDGTAYAGWQTVTVTRSIERAAAGFQLEVTERWGGQPDRRAIRPGAACAILLDSEVVIDGYVDTVSPRYEPQQHTVRISGRERIGDLVDCAAVVDGGHELAGLNLAEIAAKLCQPYGIAVANQVGDLGKPFDRFAIEPGESAWEAIERACRHRGVLATGDGKGTLLLTRAGRGGRAAAALELGRNVLAAGGSFSHQERYSLIVARGQREAEDILGADEAASPAARVTDPAVRRYRPKVIISERTGDGVTLADRAEWQRRVSAGRGTRVTYDVQGWRAAGGLWAANQLVRVRDSYLDLDGELLIVAVTFALDEQEGTKTSLELMPASAFELLPEPEDPATGLWGLA